MIYKEGLLSLNIFNITMIKQIMPFMTAKQPRIAEMIDRTLMNFFITLNISKGYRNLMLHGFNQNSN